MKNKFLKYLLEDKFKDITYSLKEINSEREKKHSKNIEEYPYIDDFFKLLFSLDVSQEEIFQSLRREKANYSLAHMLIGYETQNDKNRKEKFETFRPLIENNINFYKQIMDVALSEHEYVSEEFKEMNKEIFNEIVEIGIKKDFFNHFSDTDKQTSILEYKNILIEKNVFNTSYSIEDSIKCLNFKNKNNEKNKANHFSMFSGEIYKFLENLNEDNYETFIKSVEKVFKAEGKEEITAEKIENLFNQFIGSLVIVEKENFAPLINNELVKKSLLIKGYNNKAFSELVKQPFLLEGLLVKCNPSELIDLFQDNSGNVIKHITETSKNNIYVDEGLLVMMLDNIDKYTEETDEKENKSILIANILFNQVKKIENKLFVNKVFEKYTKNIVKSLNDIKGYSSYNNNKFNENFNKFNESKSWLDSSIWNKISKKLEIKEKDDLYKYSQKFKETKKFLNNENYYENKQFVEHLSNYINLTGDISVLNVLNVDIENPDWKNIKFDFSIDKKSYEQENILVFLIRKMKSENAVLNLIKWVVEESPDNFYELKFGVKDVLSYYQKLSITNKNSTLFADIANTILEKDMSFEKILKNNKTKLKLINVIDNESIQKKLNYHHLKQKLNSNLKVESVVLKIKNKI